MVPEMPFLLGYLFKCIWSLRPKKYPYSAWFIPWIIPAIAINLTILYLVARARNGLIPFWLSLMGGLLVIIPGYLFSNRIGSIIGIGFLLIGALLLNNLPYSQ
jgi:protein SCO1/2